MPGLVFLLLMYAFLLVCPHLKMLELNAMHICISEKNFPSYPKELNENLNAEVLPHCDTDLLILCMYQCGQCNVTLY